MPPRPLHAAAALIALTYAAALIAASTAHYRLVSRQSEAEALTNAGLMLTLVDRDFGSALETGHDGAIQSVFNRSRQISDYVSHYLLREKYGTGLDSENHAALLKSFRALVEFTRHLKTGVETRSAASGSPLRSTVVDLPRLRSEFQTSLRDHYIAMQERTQSMTAELDRSFRLLLSLTLAGAGGAALALLAWLHAVAREDSAGAAPAEPVGVAP